MGQQLLSIETSNNNPRIGEQITVNVFHQVQRENNESGAIKLSLSLFFNDNELQLDSIAYPSEGFNNSFEATLDDNNNDDNRGETNKRTAISFQQASLQSPYPDERSNIVTATFTVLNDFDGSEVSVQIPSETSQTYNNPPAEVFELRTLSLELDNIPSPEPTLSINDISLAEGNEGNTEFNFTVSLSENSTETVTVDYATVDDSAIAGEDYTAANGTLTFEPGVREQTITVQVTGDTEVEEDENFSVNLSNASGATISDNQGTAAITNDDSSPVINILDTNINRFQNEDIPGTYIFVGEPESESIRANFPNFVEEGLAFRVADEPGEDLIPLYRFQNTQTPGTFVFVDESERQSINENFSESFVEEGLAFYVYAAGSGQGTEFTRFQNEDRPGTFLFASPDEAESIRNNFPNFVEEGIAFEVEI